MEFSELEPYFPFVEMRGSQRQALEKYAHTVNKGRKFTILELPTGVGKSAIAVTLGRWAAKKGAYLLTIQKMLQEQYLADFPDLATLKGAANYTCDCYKVSCEDGPKLATMEGKTSCGGLCPYKEAKADFVASPFGVTNFAYFCSCVAQQRGLFRRRKLLIIDEAHNTEQVLINHSHIELTPSRLTDLHLPLPSPPFRGNELSRAKDWLQTKAIPAIDTARTDLSIQIDSERSKGPTSRLSYLLRQDSGWQTLTSKLNMFIDSTSDMWFLHQADGGLEIKPLTGELMAEDLLFSMADSVVFLSATILDPRTFIKNLGLSPSQCGYLGVPSEFPPEHRPVVFSPAGSMSFKHYDETLPKLLRKIEKILLRHPDEKGIIHCQSYKTMNNILQHFQGTPLASRLLGHDAKNKQQTIQAHIDSSEPTVLLSPSMTEGLDLKDDLSRFQVVAKMPFASLGDPYIKARMDMDPGWYRWQTALTLVQALGRSVRSASDHATSYIIDGDFRFFLRDAEEILPEWWVDSIQFK